MDGHGSAVASRKEGPLNDLPGVPINPPPLPVPVVWHRGRQGRSRTPWLSRWPPSPRAAPTRCPRRSRSTCCSWRPPLKCARAFLNFLGPPFFCFNAVPKLLRTESSDTTQLVGNQTLQTPCHFPSSWPVWPLLFSHIPRRALCQSPWPTRHSSCWSRRHSAPLPTTPSGNGRGRKPLARYASPPNPSPPPCIATAPVWHTWGTAATRPPTYALSQVQVLVSRCLDLHLHPGPAKICFFGGYILCVTGEARVPGFKRGFHALHQW